MKFLNIALVHCLTGGLTICQRMHKEAIKHPEMTQYVPQCNEDGDFENVQCDPGTHACWCVDKYGMEIAGTKVQGNIVCPDFGRSIVKHPDWLRLVRDDFVSFA